MVKFILAICSIFFDSIFFFQFWLYRNNKAKEPAFDELAEEGKGILDEPRAGIAPSKTVSNSGFSD